MKALRYTQIGIIHSPLKSPSEAPVQSASTRHVRGAVEVFPQYVPGLKDIRGFSHLILVYHFHRSRKASLVVKPYLDNKEHGIFATRAPVRPNPIGISIVRLRDVRGGIIRVQDLDVLDGTPLLDIKPYVPKFDVRRVQKVGWLEPKMSRLSGTRADARFTTEVSSS